MVAQLRRAWLSLTKYIAPEGWTFAPLSLKVVVGPPFFISFLGFTYSQLPPCGHPAITDTSLLRTKEKSPAETIKKYMKTDLAITDARYYGHADTSPGPKLKFSLFFSRYNGHFRYFFKHWRHLNSCIWQNNSKLALC